LKGWPSEEPFVKTILRALIRAYRYFVSPMFGPSCRFYPTCSEYADEAIRDHGVLRGSMLAAKRIACCHPWHSGGVDPVPGRRES
jgi:hypothetical protein